MYNGQDTIYTSSLKEVSYADTLRQDKRLPLLRSLNCVAARKPLPWKQGTEL